MRENATTPNNRPLSNCVSTTKNFLVLYISRNGLHRNFNVHGIMIIDVQKAICVSEMPKSLNMNVDTRFMAINGMPIAKYAVGTHVMGLLLFTVFFIVS